MTLATSTGASTAICGPSLKLGPSPPLCVFVLQLALPESSAIASGASRPLPGAPFVDPLAQPPF